MSRLVIEHLPAIYPTFEALRSAAIHEMHVSRPDSDRLTNEDVIWMIWTHYSNADDVHAAKICTAAHALAIETADKEIDLEILAALCEWYGPDYHTWLQGCSG